MTLTFGGNYPPMKRIRTGCFSLDLAVGGDTLNKGSSELGFPMRTLVYVWSRHTGIGKSAFVFSLAGRVSDQSKPHSYVGINPIDTFSRPVAEAILVHNKATGYVEFVHELRHEVGIARLEKLLRDENYCCVVFDSVAAYESSSVREGSIQDATWRNPSEIANMVSHLNGILKSASKEKIAFMTTTLRQNIGFNSMGMHTKGGRAPEEKSAIHIDLNWTYAPTLIAFPTGRLLSGEVQKNNFGLTDRAFRVFMVGGKGLHLGMTAAYDCVMFGLATGGKTFTDSFAVNGEKIGSPKKLSVLEENDPIFNIFYELLQQNEAQLCQQIITKKTMKAKLEKEVTDKKGRKKNTDDVVVKVNPDTGEVIEVEDEFGTEPEQEGDTD